MSTDCVGFILVAMVATIIVVAWLTIDQEDFNKRFERMKESGQEEN